MVFRNHFACHSVVLRLLGLVTAVLVILSQIWHFSNGFFILFFYSTFVFQHLLVLPLSPSFPAFTAVCQLGGHPFMSSTQRGIRLRWTHTDGVGVNSN